MLGTFQKRDSGAQRDLAGAFVLPQAGICREAHICRDGVVHPVPSPKQKNEKGRKAGAQSEQAPSLISKEALAGPMPLGRTASGAKQAGNKPLGPPSPDGGQHRASEFTQKRLFFSDAH